ncbi:asparagine synthase-related protein [Aquimarina sp. I32.4]|uniref:asparagine synthase-related protein n=1 Tax=Aquimarina sp. I32.4 TaxID=2053903 RepID=UPI000CDEAF28|nr:asparagine synthase-related protein [Aquimarina sp. I32.4]
MIDHFIITASRNTEPDKYHIELTEDWILTTQGNRYTHYHEDDKTIFVFGDYIGEKEILFSSHSDNIPKLRGNFYAIVVHNKTIKIYSSFLNVLPIYYTTDNSCFSSSIQYIREKSKKEFSINKKFILETLLFNYGFFNRTLYQEIQLVPCNSFLTILVDRLEIQKHLDTISMFTQHPVKGAKVVDRLSDLFIETTNHYFPDTSFDIAFTSGFDGRTLVSCATFHNKDFKTFSFGRPENDDVSIPKANAAKLNIPYKSFDLGSEEYLNQEYIHKAISYIYQYPGGNGFIYPHFLYSTEQIAKESDYLLSGIVGSELFRALHLTGAVTSTTLADVFISTTSQEIKDKITNAKALKVIQKENYKTELQELIDEVIAYKEAIPNHLTENQKFYVFVFEEIFRKFFGQWVSIQMQHVKVRTPFLDYTFIKELLATKYAGANNDFFTENPLKRMKGQYLYTDIIKKTNSIIYHQITGKGYRPKDVRELMYLYKIIIPFIKKRFKRKVKTPNLDNLGIISGTLTHKKIIEETLRETSLFDTSVLSNMLDTISPHTPEKERDTLLIAVSILIAIQYQPKTNSKHLSHYE